MPTANLPAIRAERRASNKGRLVGLCCTNRLIAGVSLSRTDLSYGLRDRDAEPGEAVQHGDADLELCDLTIKVSGAQALAALFRAMHLRFDAASAVIPAPSSPDGPSDALRCPQDFVAGDGPGGIGCPGTGVPAGRDDRGGTASGDGVMALVG